MNSVTLFSKLLRIRTYLKRINQMSWTIQQLDNQYKDIGKLNPEEQKSLLDAYLLLIEDFMNIYESLNHENENNTH